MHFKVNKSFSLTGSAIKMVTCLVCRSESKFSLLSLRFLSLFVTHTEPTKKEWRGGEKKPRFTSGKLIETEVSTKESQRKIGYRKDSSLNKRDLLGRGENLILFHWKNGIILEDSVVR